MQNTQSLKRDLRAPFERFVHDNIIAEDPIDDSSWTTCTDSPRAPRPLVGIDGDFAVMGCHAIRRARSGFFRSLVLLVVATVIDCAACVWHICAYGDFHAFCATQMASALVGMALLSSIAAYQALRIATGRVERLVKGY